MANNQPLPPRETICYFSAEYQVGNINLEVEAIPKQLDCLRCWTHLGIVDTRFQTMTMNDPVLMAIYKLNPCNRLTFEFYKLSPEKKGHSEDFHVPFDAQVDSGH